MANTKEVAFKPEWPIINFGDGTWGRVIEIKPSKNSEGVDTYIMSIIPGDLLIAFYDIPDEMLDDEKHIVTEIPAEMVKNISISPAFPTYWCYVTIFGKSCPGTQFLKGFIEAEKIMGLHKMNDLLKAKCAWLTEMYNKAVTNNMRWLKEQASVADLFNINITPQTPTNQPQVTGPIRGQG